MLILNDIKNDREKKKQAELYFIITKDLQVISLFRSQFVQSVSQHN